jgi:hypothetical protein
MEHRQTQQTKMEHRKTQTKMKHRKTQQKKRNIVKQINKNILQLRTLPRLL